SCLFSSGLQAEEKHPDDVRLVGGASRCAGRLELKHLGEWRPVVDFNSDWTVKAAAASVRLVNGNSLCQGRVEVRSDQSWSSVYEDDFDYYDAEVVCRELGCGPPSVHQGALYGEGEAPTWTKEFQCDGFESSLLDCGSSGSARNTSSPGKAVGLTCSEPVDIRLLVGGASRCNGTLEMKQSGQWRPLVDWSFNWNPQATAAVCRELDCGSAVSTQWRKKFEYRNVWKIRPSCLQSGSTLRECVQRSFGESSRYSLEIACSGNIISDVMCVLAVGLLQSSRGRSMEKQRLQCGPKSSSVKAVSPLSWTVEAQAQLETPAHLAKLLDSPVQVEEELQLPSDFIHIHIKGTLMLLLITVLSLFRA
uniref:SRCR domain-containing protein n=1 Tax=Myripristis murdjan TaxID=586833 RepID=A0A668ARM7_9TELE